MANLRVRPALRKVPLPEPYEPEEIEEFSRDDYLDRIERFRERLAARNLDVGVIYADHEHSGNLNYFAGIYSPFEESLLVIPSSSEEVYLIAGNEVIDGIANLSPLGEKVERIRIQSLSLQGFFQELAYANRSSFVDALEKTGIGKKTRLGLIGWKYFEEREIEDHLHRHFVPSFVVDCLRQLTPDDHILNASDILLNPVDGLRILHDEHQLAAIEANSTRLTNVVNGALNRLEPGMSEVDVARLIEFSGEHFLYHPIVCISAERIRLAYAQPSTKHRLTAGEQLFISLGFGGAAQAREGRFLEFSQTSLKEPFLRIYEEFFTLKFRWLENLAIGKTGGEIYQIVRQEYGKDFSVNPGHNIDAYQEWTNSVFRAGDPHLLQSGMAFHKMVFPAIDLIPSGGISLENAADYIRCGACAVSGARNFFRAEMVKQHGLGWVTRQVAATIDLVARARLDAPPLP